MGTGREGGGLRVRWWMMGSWFFLTVSLPIRTKTAQLRADLSLG